MVEGNPGYRTIRVHARVLVQARELIQQVRDRGVLSLPKELQPYFRNGLTPSDVIEAALHLLRERWVEESKKDGPH